MAFVKERSEKIWLDRVKGRWEIIKKTKGSRILGF
jgi:hypothetical protein